MIKTYIIHVSDDYAREKHIRNQLAGKNLDVEFVLDGDIKDLTEDILSNIFSREMSMAYCSCTYKHLLAYKEVMAGTNEVAIVLEDDIVLSKNFDAVLQQLISEINDRKLSNFLISLEDSTLTYIPRSRRIKGQLIYQKNKGRTAGAYLIDKKAAKSIWDEVKECKVEFGTDWFHNVCVEKGRIKMYWSHPAIAIQGSLNGQMGSYLAGTLGAHGRIDQTGRLRVWSVRAQRLYKKLLYEFK